MSNNSTETSDLRGQCISEEELITHFIDPRKQYCAFDELELSRHISYRELTFLILLNFAGVMSFLASTIPQSSLCLP